jgi:hypothetical protein
MSAFEALIKVRDMANLPAIAFAFGDRPTPPHSARAFDAVYPIRRTRIRRIGRGSVTVKNTGVFLRRARQQAVFRDWFGGLRKDAEIYETGGDAALQSNHLESGTNEQAAIRTRNEADGKLSKRFRNMKPG